MAADAGRRRGRRRLPADRRPGQPSDITMALAKGARMAGRHDLRGRRRSPASRSRAAASRRSSPTQGRIACDKRRDLRRAVGARRSARMAGVNVPLVSVQHQYSSPSRSIGVPREPADAARSRPPHLLQGGGRRAGDGRLRAEPQALGDRRACPSDFDVPAARRRLGPFRADAWSWRSAACRRCRRPASSS